MRIVGQTVGAGNRSAGSREAERSKSEPKDFEKHRKISLILWLALVGSLLAISGTLLYQTAQLPMHLRRPPAISMAPREPHQPIVRMASTSANPAGETKKTPLAASIAVEFQETSKK